MPVDRVRRDEAAKVLAAFLRGAIGRKRAWTEFACLSIPEDSKHIKDEYLDTQDVYWYLSSQYTWISKETWDDLCRHLAFLLSNLEVQHSEVSLPDAFDPTPLERRWSQWLTLGLFISFGVAYWTSWWLLLPAIPGLFLLYKISMTRSVSLANQERDRKLQMRYECSPFADKAQWLAHKHLLEQFHIPAYDVQTFEDKSEPNMLLKMLNCYAFSLFLYSLIAFYYLACAIFWPIWALVDVFAQLEAKRSR